MNMRDKNSLSFKGLYQNKLYNIGQGAKDYEGKRAGAGDRECWSARGGRAGDSLNKAARKRPH